MECMLRVERVTKILSVGCDDLPKELQGRFWSAVAGLFSCRIQDDSEEYISGDGTDSTDSLVVPGVANILVDAVVIRATNRQRLYTHRLMPRYQG